MKRSGSIIGKMKFTNFHTAIIIKSIFQSGAFVWKVISVVIVTAFLTVGYGSPDLIVSEVNHKAVRVNFDQQRHGNIPQQFIYHSVGLSKPMLSAGRPLWRVVRDIYAPSSPFAMIQAAAVKDMQHFAIATLRGHREVRGSVSVDIRMIAGTIARRAGVIWQMIDKDNYNAVMIDDINGRLSWISMKEGVATKIISVPVPEKIWSRDDAKQWLRWYKLHIDFSAHGVSAKLDGQRLFTFTRMTSIKIGLVGLVTQADTIAAFDDLIVFPKSIQDGQ